MPLTVGFPPARTSCSSYELVKEGTIGSDGSVEMQLKLFYTEVIMN